MKQFLSLSLRIKAHECELMQERSDDREVMTERCLLMTERCLLHAREVPADDRELPAAACCLLHALKHASDLVREEKCKLSVSNTC
jgi:hypothetical protein